MNDWVLEIGPAAEEELPAVASLFMESFTETFDHLFGSRWPARRASLDLFTFLYRVEPERFVVAREGGQIVGYAVTPRSIRYLWMQFLIRGYFLRWGWRLLNGDYGIRVFDLGGIFRNKLVFIRSPQNFRRHDAQVLSVAVAKEARGRGVAALMLDEGLKRLQTAGVREVKLEVRPWNTPARRLYRRLGFKQIGTTRDSQGEWAVMVKQL